MNRGPEAFNHDTNMPALDTLRFRSSPHVEIKRLADLQPDQREPFVELDADPNFYGLFVPKPPLRINLKSVQRPAAELFLHLATPRPLDGAWLDDPNDADDIVDLVLDGFLEVEHDGQWLFGGDALPILCAPLAPLQVNDAAARLSRNALLHAQDIESNDAAILSGALYLYHRIPLTPFWRTRLPGRDAVRAHLGVNGGALHSLLDREWIETTPEEPNGWLSWSSRIKLPRDPDRASYKLYVSPRPEWVRDAFAVVARLLSDFPGLAFKVGDDAVGFLRPEKLVLYLGERDALAEAAALLRRELSGCEAHGVPFTAGLDDSGLLSWGMDPPENDRPLKWLDYKSWRSWITQRLGAAMAIGKLARSASALEPWRFAVEYVRRQGMDVETWTPTPKMWSTS